MKAFIAAIILNGAFVLTGIGDTTNEQANTAPQMSMRTYKIVPETFYSGLKHQIVAKDGESEINLLRRFFRERDIDLDNPKASVFLNERLGLLFVKVTPNDQDKVERLVVRIVNQATTNQVQSSVTNTNAASLTAEQAKTVAMRLANDRASTLYHCQPFRDGQSAQFVAGRWLWVERQGFGHSDFQATVELAADGSTNNVDLQLFDSQNQLLHGRQQF